MSTRYRSTGIKKEFNNNICGKPHWTITTWVFGGYVKSGEKNGKDKAGQIGKEVQNRRKKRCVEDRAITGREVNVKPLQRETLK